MMFNTTLRRPDRTWVKIGTQTYGARSNRMGPSGGGKGYRKIVTRGTCKVSTIDALLDALKKAQPGNTVFIPTGVELDCTERVHIDKLVFEIPAGVTLAGDRGAGRSEGALLHSDTFDTRPLIRALGPDVRVTGLRLQGPDPKPRLEHHRRCFAEGRGHEYYYKFPISVGVWTEYPALEVDNCEVAGWSLGAIYLKAGDRQHVHHNFIHHNQYNGLGYGLCLEKAFALIESNLFNYNRHSIAGDGSAGSGYEACDNIELGHSLSHCFDMHGGADRQDGTDIAGTWLKIHHNTFRCPRTPIVIRGMPEQGVDVHHNWFLYHPQAGILSPTWPSAPKAAVVAHGRTHIHDNACGRAQPRRQDPHVTVIGATS